MISHLKRHRRGIGKISTHSVITSQSERHLLKSTNTFRRNDTKERSVFIVYTGVRVYDMGAERYTSYPTGQHLIRNIQVLFVIQ